jgi:hypothetical protein
MTANDIVVLIQAQPFVPFSLQMPSGRVHRVVHPELVALSPLGNTLALFEPDGSLAVVDIPSVEGAVVETGKSGKRRGQKS